MKTWLRRLAQAVVLVVILGMVFAAYLEPGFMLDMASRLYTCF